MTEFQKEFDYNLKLAGGSFIVCLIIITAFVVLHKKETPQEIIVYLNGHPIAISADGGQDYMGGGQNFETGICYKFKQDSNRVYFTVWHDNLIIDSILVIAKTNRGNFYKLKP